MTDLKPAFSPEVMKELAKPYSPVDPRAYELGGSAQWCVIEVKTRDVEDELIKRRFGIYVPELEETIISRGRPIDQRVPMFPGYVFAFVYLDDANWLNLATTPGVLGILGVLTDDQVDRIRKHENFKRPVELQQFPVQQVVGAASGKKRPKRYRKSRKPVTVMVPDEIVLTRPWSAFEDAVVSLDSEGRNQALRDLLGHSS